MNPFLGRFPIEDRADWIGPMDAFEELENNIHQRVNTYVYGVQGCGKSSLLKCFFTLSYRRKMAASQKILIFPADLSTRNDGEDICAYLEDQLKYHIKRLLAGSDDLPDIKDVFQAVDSKDSETRFRQIVTTLHEELGYFFVLVMDGFERFTSSPSITMEHHELLRSLIEQGALLCVIATDYDLSQDSLPVDVRGSYLLQKFTGAILLTGLSADEAEQFIARRQKDSEIKLSKRTVSGLYHMSGGIPWLLCAAAEQAYKNVDESGNVKDAGWTTNAAYRACLPILTDWCKLLTPVQVTVLRMLADCAVVGKPAVRDFTGEQTDLQNAVSALKDRGLLRQADSHTDGNGNIRKSGAYEVSFNSMLFQRFCCQGGMESAVKNNPLRAAAQQRDHQPSPPYQQVFIDKFFSAGAADTSTTINAENVQIVNQGITAGQLLDMMADAGSSREMFANRLAGQIRKQLSGVSFPPLVRGEGVSDEEFADQEDAAFDQYSRHILQDVEVDEEQDLVDVTPTELQTLDARFQNALTRQPGRAITDSLLGKLSERCRFYLKLALVVEDALDFPGVFIMEDYSPQIVIYGKAFEQALRDGLYGLFKREPTLSAYDTKYHAARPNSENAFRNMSMRRAGIRNYVTLIQDKSDYLGGLCSSKNVQSTAGGAAGSWSDWWHRFQSDINAARKIRNRIHPGDDVPGDTPGKADLNKLCDLLLGQNGAPGILESSLVGKRLYAGIFAPHIPIDVQQNMIGSTCDITCTVFKPNGGIKGVTSQEGYVVNISPSRVHRFRETWPSEDFDPLDRHFNVRILEFNRQNDLEYFGAEIVNALL